MGKKKTSDNSIKDFEKLKNELKSIKDQIISNGLSDALLGPGTGITSQLSEVDTLFKNTRWYFISNMRQVLSQIYVEHGLIQTIVDVPVDDAMKGGITLSTKQLDEDQITQLEKLMKRKGDENKLSEAIKWKRLFGGSAILILTDQDPETELDKSKITKDSMLEFRAIDMWELFFDQQETKGAERELGPKLHDNVVMFNYYGQKIHKSRVIKMVGKQAPSFLRPRLRGWGMSVVEPFVRSINQYLKATDLVFEVLDEFKLDIYKIKGLTSTLLQSNGTAKIQNRVALANQQKNYQNALTMDAEDDYVQKQLSFSGIADTMEGIKMQIASDLRMPLTKIFGVSSAGFNSGEGDIENYNSMVEGSIRDPMYFDHFRMIELRSIQLFGFVPDDLEVERKPLRTLTSVDEENVKTEKFNRTSQAKQTGDISGKEFREACNKDNLLPLQLDTKSDALNPEELPEPNEKVTTVSTQKGEGSSLSNNSDYGVNNFEGKRVAIVALTSGNKILTGKRNDNGLWVSPGGHVDEGEDFKDAAIRETFEESGIKLLKNNLVLVYEGVINNGDKDFAIVVYKASIPEQVATSEYDPDKEVGIWKWVEMDLGKSKELRYENRHACANDKVIKHIVECPQ